MEVPRWFADLLLQQLQGIVELSPLQLEQLYSHYELLVKWNEKINLTSVRAPEEIVVRHYRESLFFGAQLPDAPAGTSIADIGSGAGFPGVPMAILRPDWRVTLVESHQRKAVFLRECSRGLGNIAVVPKRAETMLDSFDWVVSRAVRAEDVMREVPRLGRRIGLLLGQADWEKLKLWPDVTWREPIQVPWAEKQFCIFGQCST
jgi:16S rRNA (guanine527-N7)-methyltransferase